MIKGINMLKCQKLLYLLQEFSGQPWFLMQGTGWPAFLPSCWTSPRSGTSSWEPIRSQNSALASTGSGDWHILKHCASWGQSDHRTQRWHQSAQLIGRFWNTTLLRTNQIKELRGNINRLRWFADSETLCFLRPIRSQNSALASTGSGDWQILKQWLLGANQIKELRAGINRLRWLADSETMRFLGPIRSKNSTLASIGSGIGRFWNIALLGANEITELSAGINRLRWLADSETLCFWGANQIKELRAGINRLRWLANSETLCILGPIKSHISSVITIVSGDRQILNHIVFLGRKSDHSNRLRWSLKWK